MKDGPLRVGEHVIDISNADKLFFPDDGLTKGDLVAYYRDLAEVMVPHLNGRPLALQRFPDGITRDGFFQKDASDYFPDWLCTADVPRRGRGRGGTVEHVYVCDNPATLVYLANQGTITFHVWPALTDDLQHPDLLVFDLDPSDRDLDAVRGAARALRDLLREVGLTPFVQTTGSKGFHVVTSLDRSADFDTVRAFARDMARLIVQRDPERLTVEQRKAKRAGRVFIDTNRNAYAQHGVAPYSVRPQPGAPVATPIDWHELGRVEPRSYTIRNLKRRLGQKDDPWADLHRHARPLALAREALAEIRNEG